MSVILQLQRSETVDWPVKVGEDAFTITCRRPNKGNQLAAIEAGWPGKIEVWERQVIGWKGVVDESGTEIPFSQGAWQSALNVPEILDGVINALSDLFFRSDPEKNSEASAPPSSTDGK